MVHKSVDLYFIQHESRQRQLSAKQRPTIVRANLISTYLISSLGRRRSTLGELARRATSSKYDIGSCLHTFCNSCSTQLCFSQTSIINYGRLGNLANFIDKIDGLCKHWYGVFIRRILIGLIIFLRVHSKPCLVVIYGII